MHKRSVRATAAAFVALTTAAVLSSCSVGVEAGTLDPQRLSGTEADVGLVKIRNALIVAPEDEGGSTELTTTIINDGATEDALTGVELAGPDGPVEIPLRQAVELPPEAAVVIPSESGPSLPLDDVEVEPGSYVDATFVFETAGSVTLRLLVLSHAGVHGGEGGAEG